MLANHQIPLVSIVVPVYNEGEVLFKFYERLVCVLQKTTVQFEVLFVNDGSQDNSLEILKYLLDFPTDNIQIKIGIINLSRNFGKEIALTAGLDHAKGQAVIVIDADLQDPPEVIPKLLTEWQKGYDVVYGQRITRKGEGLIKKGTAFLFYRILNKMSQISIPIDTGDFRLISRRALNTLKTLRERHRFMKGLFAWVGFETKAVLYEREPRIGGVTKWNYWKLWNLAVEGITSFSIAPLKIATYLGCTTALSAFLYALIIIYKTLMYGEPVQGYPSLMVVILFLGGVQLLSLGIIGEYLGRTFDETKQRPLYIVQDFFQPEEEPKRKSSQKKSQSVPELLV